MGQAPFGHDGAAPAHNAGDPLGGFGYVGQAHTRMDGEVVHALLGLLNQGIAEDLPGKVLGLAVYLFQGLVDGHGTDGHGGVTDDPFAGLVDVVARTQVHDGIGTPAAGPYGLFHFFLNRAGDGRVANVGVDLHQKVSANDHGLGLGVVDVGGDDGAARGHFITHKLGRNFALGGIGAKVLARMLAILAGFFQALIFANGDILHFGRDDALARVMQLRYILPGLGLAGLAQMLKAQLVQLLIGQALLSVAGGKAFQLLGILTAQDPGVAQGRQAPAHVDFCLGVGVGAAGVVHRYGGIFFHRCGGVEFQSGGMQRDFAHGHLDVVQLTGHVYLPRHGEGIAGDLLLRGRFFLFSHFLGGLAAGGGGDDEYLIVCLYAVVGPGAAGNHRFVDGHGHTGHLRQIAHSQ